MTVYLDTLFYFFARSKEEDEDDLPNWTFDTVRGPSTSASVPAPSPTNNTALDRPNDTTPLVNANHLSGPVSVEPPAQHTDLDNRLSNTSAFSGISIPESPESSMSVDNGGNKSVNGLVHNPETVVGEDMGKIGSSRQRDPSPRSSNASVGDNSFDHSQKENSPSMLDNKVCDTVVFVE